MNSKGISHATGIKSLVYLNIGRTIQNICSSSSIVKQIIK